MARPGDFGGAFLVVDVLGAAILFLLLMEPMLAREEGRFKWVFDLADAVEVMDLMVAVVLYELIESAVAGLPRLLLFATDVFFTCCFVLKPLSKFDERAGRGAKGEIGATPVEGIVDSLLPRREVNFVSMPRCRFSLV